MTRLLAALLSALLALPACSRKADPPDLIVLHTGRLRGNVVPSGTGVSAPLQYYGAIAGYVHAVREEAAARGAQVLLVDLGDSLGGSFASHVSGGANMAAFFNALSYDAICLGNLDADVPVAALAKIQAKVLCPFVNKDGEALVPGASVAAAFTKGKHTIRLVSNFHGDLPRDADPLRFPATFGPEGKPAFPARDPAGSLTALGVRGPDDIALFSWMKFEPSAEPPLDFLGALKKAGFDAILAHRVYGRTERDAWRPAESASWDPPISENILRNNLGFTIARMDLKKTPSGWAVLRREVVPASTLGLKPHPVLERDLAELKESIGAADQTVGRLPRAMNHSQIYALYLAAMATVKDAEAVVYSPEAIRDEWPAGELRASAVFHAFPWTGPLRRITMSREQFEELRNLPRLDVRYRETGGANVHVVTSHYFADVVALHLGVDPAGFGEVVAPAEFDFFVAYLKSLPEIAPPGSNALWNTVP